MTITIQHYLLLSGVLFILGLLGMVLRKNLLVVFMCLEVLLNAINLALVAISRYYGVMDGHVVAFFIMVLAASEAGIGLGIVLLMYRKRHSIKTTDWQMMKG